MLLRFILKKMTFARQAEFMKRKGLLLTTRTRGEKTTHLYMFRNLFAEIEYEQSDPSMPPRSVKLISGIKKLNEHLAGEGREKE